MTDFGAEIAVDGKRPDWLKDDRETVLRISSRGHEDWTGKAVTVAWSSSKAIRLPADHPYYKATEAGYKYWPGGDKAPDDWNGGVVLLRDGSTCPADKIQWWKCTDGWLSAGDIIGYHRRPMAPIIPPAAGRYLSPGEVDELVRAVQGGDITAAQALIDPVVLRARELCNNRGFSFDGISEDIRDVIIAALRESNRPPEEKLKAIVRNVVYTARVEGGHFAGWTTVDILSGKYDNTDLFKQMMKAAYNAI